MLCKHLVGEQSLLATARCAAAPTRPFPAKLDAVTTARIRLLGPFVLRFGGTSQDMEQYIGDNSPFLPKLPHAPAGRCNLTNERWSDLTSFAAAVNARLVYGLNGLVRVDGNPAGLWDPANAKALLHHAASTAQTAGATSTADNGSMPAAPLAFQLGNEPSFWGRGANNWCNVTAAQHAADYATLGKEIKEAFNGATGMPLAVGPDLTELTVSSAATEYMGAFLAANPALDVVTIHVYPIEGARDGPPAADQMYNSTLLDTSFKAAQSAVQLTSAHLGDKVPVWVSEGSPNWRASSTLQSSVLFELANVDMLGSFARAGVRLYARQSLSSVVGPGVTNPGYWVTLLWKQLMGDNVLHAAVHGGAGSLLRTYSHEDAQARGYVVLLINISPADRVLVQLAAQNSSSMRSATCSIQEEYHVTAGSGNNRSNSGADGDEAGSDANAGSVVLINGVAPCFKSSTDATRPRFKAKQTTCGTPVKVEPLSFTFVAVRPVPHAHSHE